MLLNKNENKENNKFKIQFTQLFQKFQCQITNNFFKYQNIE
jgi:hypothetical protein